MELEWNNGRHERLSVKERIFLAVGAVTVVGAGVFLWKSEQDLDEHELKIEDCVSELTEQDVNLEQDEDGRIMRPAVVYDEVTACLRADGDPDRAALYIESE